MIPVGRDVLNWEGIAELHGLTMRQARRSKPWALPDHPAPITPGRATRGRPTLWDYDQAAAFAAGDTVPPLPDAIHDDDLLDRFEAAAEAEVAATAWEQDQYRDRVPAPDEEVHGIPLWYRSTVTAYRDQRTAAPRRRGDGRPPGNGETRPRAEIRAAVHQLLREATETGQPISTAAIARQLGIHYTTAIRHVHAIRDNPDQPGGYTVQPIVGR